MSMKFIAQMIANSNGDLEACIGSGIMMFGSTCLAISSPGNSLTTYALAGTENLDRSEIEQAIKVMESSMVDNLGKGFIHYINSIPMSYGDDNAVELSKLILELNPDADVSYLSGISNREY